VESVVAVALCAFGDAPITSVLVSVLKRIPVFEQRTAPELTFGVATFLWVLAALIGAAGYGVQFNNLMEALTTIIPAVLGLLVSFPGATVTHDAMAKANVPVLGYKRTRGVVAAPIRAFTAWLPPTIYSPGGQLNTATGAVPAILAPRKKVMSKKTLSIMPRIVASPDM